MIPRNYVVSISSLTGISQIYGFCVNQIIGFNMYQIQRVMFSIVYLSEYTMNPKEICDFVSTVIDLYSLLIFMENPCKSQTFLYLSKCPFGLAVLGILLFWNWLQDSGGLTPNNLGRRFLKGEKHFFGGLGWGGEKNGMNSAHIAHI